eukprot:TRINITY_DN7210_c0_g4_i4.p1 TRINITY_DN7210_c0_g4~~TRINITY_DN7210_c0_g4_i4.p1  ORF type:complete len:489 (-),score=79.07 TRINITY_DN7210_c0_g4_i4:446-1912(-)
MALIDAQLDQLESQLNWTNSRIHNLTWELTNLTAKAHLDYHARVLAENTMWLLLTAPLVFFMNTGFAMLESGSISKGMGVPIILLKNVGNTGVTCIAWYLVGYGIAFGDDYSTGGNVMIGTSYFATHRIPESSTVSYAHWFFQFTFCCASTTIVSGAVAERARTSAFFFWGFFYASWIYPMVTHWSWSNAGWMSIGNPKPILGVGILDFAGSGVVHLMGGSSALVAAAITGARHKRWDKVYIEKGVFANQSEAWMALGSMMLWFSWFGFNCGSSILIVGYSEIVSLVAVNTVLAPSISCLTGLAAYGLLFRRFSLPVALNCILCGLVAITSGCAYVDPWGGFVIGAVSGPLYVTASRFFTKLKLDDPVDACAVHFSGGVWGIFAPGLLATQRNVMLVTGKNTHWGLFLGGGGEQLGLQCVALVVMILWSSSWSLLIYLVLSKFSALRLPLSKERQQFQERLDELAVIFFSCATWLFHGLCTREWVGGG